MLKNAQVAIFVLPLSVLSLSTAGPSGFSSKEDLLAAYEPAAQRLQAFYTNLYISADITKSNWVYMPHQPPGEKVEFRANGRLIRSDRVIEDAAHPETIVQVAGAQRGFVVSKAPGANAFILDTWHANPELTTESSRLFNPLAFAPYCILEVTILEWMKRPSVRLRAVEEVQEQGELLLKATFDETFKREGQVLHLSHRFLFEPQRNWACRRYAYGGTNPECAEIEYEGEVDGIPLIKSATYWKEDKGKRANMTHATVRKLIVGPVPEDQFTLAAFGIAEPVEGTARASTYAAIGVATLVVALLLSLWARRRFGAASKDS